MSAFWDDLKADMEATNPARAAAFEAAYLNSKAQLDRAVQVNCAWGNCVNDVDPLDGKVIGGFGATLCPCDNLPGWNSSYPAGMARPAVPARATGKHGSRVQRSRRRHQLPTLLEDEWLSPRAR